MATSFMRKKIVLFCKSLSNSGGIERMTANLANRLCCDYSVYVVTCEDDGHIFYNIDKSVVIISLYSKFFDRIRSMLKFRQLMNSLSPHVVINVAVAMGQISIPALLFMRNRPKIIAWEHFSIHAGSKMGYLFRLLSSMLCYRTVVLTNRDKLDYPIWLQRNILTIYNFTAFNSPEEINRDNPIVLTVGRLSYEKGYDKLLKIWEKVVKKNPNWRLIIVGNGPCKESLLHQINDLDLKTSVEIVAATKNIIDYYDKASIFVMTSRHEGLPMVLIEAKMRGLPCVCYNFPNGPDEIINNGKDGYVVELDDEERFVEALIDLMSKRNLRTEFGKQAIFDANLRFSANGIINQWLSLIGEVCS